MIKYSIIIPFHSNLNLLTICVNALYKVLDFSESELIIVDNNVDGSQIDSNIETDKHCTIISKKENLMYPRAINMGAANARGDYLIFCDADTCVSKDFHKLLVKELETDGIGYASAKLVNMYTNNLQAFGITSSYYNFPHPFYGRPINFKLIQNNHYPMAACAACSAIKRELFYDIGGFDEKLIHSYSDIDLCLRLKQKGYKTVCVAEAYAYHCGSSTTGSGMGISLKEDTKGIFMSKHPNIPIQIDQYIDNSCDYFLTMNKLHNRDYFIMDCSTIGNPELYIDRVIRNLNIAETLRYRHPYPQRDATHIDFLNFISHIIRNYKVPILYFVDSFLSFRENCLWKSCRTNFDDIVVDRHANVELLRNIN